MDQVSPNLKLGDGLANKINRSKSREALDLYRSGAVKPVPIKTFDVSEITQAYRYFSQKNRVGKVVVSMQNPQSIVQVSHYCHCPSGSSSITGQRLIER